MELMPANAARSTRIYGILVHEIVSCNVYGNALL